MSLRERLSSPEAGKALVSPGGLLAAGAGAAVGIVATAPLAIPLAAVGALVGGAVGLGVTAWRAAPKPSARRGVDPFAVREPWRHAVVDAVQAQGRFTKAARSLREGPMRDNLGAIAARIEDAVEQCWQVAQHGQMVADARRSINDKEIAWELRKAHEAVEAAKAQGADGPSDNHARTIAALQSQMDTATRLDEMVESAKERLELLNARLDESVTRAIELSVTNRTSGVASLGADVEGIVEDMEALRRAIEAVEEEVPPPLPRGGTAVACEGA